MQTRLESLLETLSNTFIGVLGALLITYVVLEYVPLGTLAKSVLNVTLCTLWSIVRSYAIRRHYNRRMMAKHAARPQSD